MANITETGTWDSVYLIEENDFVQGYNGSDIGTSNLQGQALANRDLYLKNTKENVANKTTDIHFTENSDILYPSQKAVKSYVNNQIQENGNGNGDS